MEVWDLYDDCMEKTGETHIRGEELPAGRYHLVVHIYPINSEGKILIQKRADTVSVKAGSWAATGGAVITGETFWEGSKRELKEELGIEATKENTELISIFKRKDHFTSIWLVHIDIVLSKLQLQREEVAKAKWVSKEELFQMTEDGEYWRYDYMEWLLNNIV